jgi:hypothetical protein
MYFDPERNAYIDEETGQVIYYEDDAQSSSVIRSAMATAVVASPQTLPLSSSHGKKKKKRGGSGSTGNYSAHGSPYHALSVDAVDVEYADRGGTYVIPPNSHGSLGQPAGIREEEFIITNPEEFERMFELAAMQNASSAVGSGTGGHSPATRSGTTTAAHSQNTESDWNFARTLQLLEFEIANEEMMYGEGQDEFDDFQRKEYRASRSCRRQLATISFFICIVQVSLSLSQSCPISSFYLIISNSSILLVHRLLFSLRWLKQMAGQLQWKTQPLVHLSMQWFAMALKKLLSSSTKVNGGDYSPLQCYTQVFGT